MITLSPGLGYEPLLRQFCADRVATRLGAGDASLWGTAAAEEASRRLGWLSRSGGELLDQIGELRTALERSGVDRIVLCGMGGSSLGPEVVAARERLPLRTLDSSHPDAVRAHLDDLERTAVVVSSKSGSTLETDSQRRAFEAAFTAAGIDPASRIIVVTDPGSPLAELAQASGYRMFLADPNVGGRYSVFTAFGLVPTGLAGADLPKLLGEADTIDPQLAEDSPANPALQLAALMGAAQASGADKMVLAEDPRSPGLAAWIEQLVAESTGKQGRGILPVIVESGEREYQRPAADCFVVNLAPDLPTVPVAAAIDAPLGAQFVLWEWATALVGRAIGINPFDQPDVESAKAAARGLLEQRTEFAPDFVEGSISVRGTAAGTLAGAIDELASGLAPTSGYLGVMAYLPEGVVDARALRQALGERTPRPITFGWGPRFLHSTGQLHKGGPATGAYLQITAPPVADLAIPGRDYSFGDLIAAQARGDAEVLRSRGRNVVELHLLDQEAGLRQLWTLLG